MPNGTNKRPSPAAPRRRIGRRGVLAGAAIGALAAPHVACAAPRVARFAHTSPDDSHYGQGLAAFAAAVASHPLLASALTIEIYPNSELGDDLGAMRNCARGTLDGALISLSLMAALVPEVGIVNAPYLFRDVAQARAVLDGPIGAEFAELAAAKSLPVLAWGENGVRHITANRPVRTLADLRGLKIRVPPSDIFLNGFRALGADPAPLAFGLLRAALVTGEFQAQENAIILVETTKLYEVQKYLCMTGHIYDAVGFVASPDLMEDLAPPQREALAACARAGAAVTRTVADATARDGTTRLKAAGMTIIDDVDLASLRAAGRPFLESLTTVYGETRVKNLLAAGA